MTLFAICFLPSFSLVSCPVSCVVLCVHVFLSAADCTFRASGVASRRPNRLHDHHHQEARTNETDETTNNEPSTLVGGARALGTSTTVPSRPLRVAGERARRTNCAGNRTRTATDEHATDRRTTLRWRRTRSMADADVLLLVDSSLLWLSSGGRLPALLHTACLKGFCRLSSPRHRRSSLAPIIASANGRCLLQSVRDGPGQPHTDTAERHARGRAGTRSEGARNRRGSS